MIAWKELPFPAVPDGGQNLRGLVPLPPRHGCLCRSHGERTASDLVDHGRRALLPSLKSTFFESLARAFDHPPNAGEETPLPHLLGSDMPYPSEFHLAPASHGEPFHSREVHLSTGRFDHLHIQNAGGSTVQHSRSRYASQGQQLQSNSEASNHSRETSFLRPFDRQERHQVPLDSNDAQIGRHISPGTQSSHSLSLFPQNPDIATHHRVEQSSSSEEDVLLQEARRRAMEGSAASKSVEEWMMRVRTTVAGQNAGVSSQMAKLVKDTSAKDVKEQGIKLHVGEQVNGQDVDVFSRASRVLPNKLQFEAKKLLTLAEVINVPRFSNSMIGSIGLIMVGALLVAFGLIYSAQQSSRRQFVKRRILRSQWYGNSGPQSWGQRNFQMRISEFPKYPILEVDGDKKILRFPVHTGDLSSASAAKGSWQHTPGSKYRPSVGTNSRASAGRGKYGGNQLKRDVEPVFATNKDALSMPKRIGTTDYRASAHPQHGDEKGWVSFEDKVSSVKEPTSSTVNSFTSGRHFKRTNSSHLLSHTQESDERPQKPSFTKFSGHGHWHEEDELDLDRRIKKLYQTIQAVEQHRRAAMLALAEEKQRSLDLEKEMMKQREAAAALGEEVRLLKESHDALLTSLQKKYSSPAAVRAAADLVYQDLAVGDSIKKDLKSPKG